MTDTDNDPCDWRDDVRDTYGNGPAAQYFIADVERLLVEHRAITLAYDSEEPADTYAAVLDIREYAEELMRALFNPRAASWIATRSGAEPASASRPFRTDCWRLAPPGTGAGRPSPWVAAS